MYFIRSRETLTLRYVVGDVRDDVTGKAESVSLFRIVILATLPVTLTFDRSPRSCSRPSYILVYCPYGTPASNTALDLLFARLESSPVTLCQIPCALWSKFSNRCRTNIKSSLLYRGPIRSPGGVGRSRRSTRPSRVLFVPGRLILHA